MRGIQIALTTTPDQIAATFDVMAQLRPHLARAEYVALIQRLIAEQGFHLLALTDAGAVRAVARYRFTAGGSRTSTTSSPTSKRARAATAER